MAYVWGYNGEYPVAKIENATIQEVADVFGLSISGLTNFLESNPGTIDFLRSSLTDALVTYYEYDPLVGVTSITDPRGYTTYYEYDDFNRLKAVKDADGKILSQNEYHYKGQQ